MSPAARMLPDAGSTSLYLTHPTKEERLATWTLNSVAWSGALTQTDYLEREEHMLKAPLAKDDGITHWILVERDLPPNERPILGSCETLRKRALVSKEGTITEVITHGIGSVFCNPHYRGRRYASRMMREFRARASHLANRRHRKGVCLQCAMVGYWQAILRRPWMARIS